MKLFSINIPPIIRRQAVQQKKPNLNFQLGPIADTFQHSVKKYPDFKYDTADSTFPNYRLIKKKRHSDRMAKYGNEECPPAKEVPKSEYKAILDVQYERDEYLDVQEKLKKHLPLTPNEEKFVAFILSQMKPVKEDTVLWRAVGIYDGFEEQVKDGKMRFDALTSTCSQYNDFFDFWYPEEHIEVDDRIIAKEGYMLKINIPAGTKVLDCNAVHKGQGTRMRGEVILPPSLWQVDSIDNDLKVIELSPLKNTANAE